MSLLYKTFSKLIFILCSIICFTNIIATFSGITILVINQDAIYRSWKVCPCVLIQTIFLFSSAIFILGSLISLFKNRNEIPVINIDRNFIDGIDIIDVNEVPPYIIRQKMLTHLTGILIGVNVAISILLQIIYYNIDSVSITIVYKNVSFSMVFCNGIIILFLRNLRISCINIYTIYLCCNIYYSMLL